MKPSSPIAQEIARVRRALDLTLAEFAARTGIPWQSVARYERGAIPPADRLLVIVHAARKIPFRVGRVVRAVARDAAA